jgi:4-hydroxy-tetrahydrodipicolinate synthase
MMDLYPTGVFCAALTPVTANLAPDVPALVQHCRWLLAQGCDGIALLGTTGEASSFSVDERKAILEGVVEQGIPADQLLPGTGCAALSDTVTLTKHAIRLGVAGVVVLPPFYYKEVTVDGLTASYEAVIERVGDARLKVVLYHIPPVAQVPIPVPLIDRLRDRYPDTVVGIKDSGGDFAHMVELVRRFPGLAVLAGADPLMLPLLREGGSGCITATSNLAARELATIYAGWRDPARAAEVEAAQARISEVRALVSHWPQIAALKGATALRTGRPGWALPRPPLMALTETERAELQFALEASAVL